MWYWLRKNTPEQTLGTFILLSAVMHVGILGWFFFGFKDRSSQLSLMITPEMLNNQVEFVFHPVQKKQAGSGAKIAQKKSSTASKKEKPHERTVDMKTSVAQKNNVKAPVKKSAPAKKTKLPEKKVEKKQPEPKKQELKKEAEPAKPEPVKKEVEKKEETVAQQSTDPIALSTGENGAIQQQIGIHERGLIEEFVAFQKEIVTVWAPPPGVAHDCSCLVSIIVDMQGMVKDMSIIKSSGVLVYDTSARAALAKMSMPRWTWGKTITITFNQ